MVIIILAVLGLCFGSFINALVWRLHEQGKKKPKPKNLSILNGRSICPNCKHVLAPQDLLPVISWLWLGGKCRYCRKPISAQYPLVELLTTALFMISYVYWPFVFNNQGTTLFVFWLVFLVGLVALTVYDLKWQLLPDKIIFPFMYLAAAQSLILLFIVSSPLSLVTDLAVSLIIGGGIFYVIFQISGGRWIGGGDVKLGALLGLILATPSLSIFTIFAASLLGTAVSMPLLATHKANRSTRIPFGPFLIAGAIIARLFGLSLVNWYKHRFLYY